MKLNIFSFRFRIIITIIVVTSLVSSVSFYLYNRYLMEEFYKTSEENILNVLDFLRDEIIDIHDGRLINPLLKELESDDHIINAILLDKEGQVTSSDDPNLTNTDLSGLREFMGSKEDIRVQIFRSRKDPVSRAYLHVTNQQECYECHAPEETTLGYIVMDISLQQRKSTINYTRRFSILFTASMVTIIMAFVLIMHFKFIRKSLSRFQVAIREINQGNLDKRVEIKETSELAELGSCFNQMVDNFQWTQQELFQSHQKEMESAEKLATIGEMAARLAHDVKNPLTGISNSIEIIAEEMKDSESLPILKEIQRQTQRVNVAVSNLLKYSRSMDINPRKGNINDLVSSLVFFLKSQKQYQQVEFVFNPGPRVPELFFDSEQLENVLMNLCLNALQAIQKKGRIVVTTSHDEEKNCVCVSVMDDGPGIPDLVAKDIFKPFFTTRTEGTGLGLAIAKDIIDKHQGRIWFEKGSAGGTIFHISLPVERKVKIDPTKINGDHEDTGN